MFPLRDRSTTSGLCVRLGLVGLLLSIALGGASAEAKSVAKTKIRFVAIGDGSRITISGSATAPASAVTARGRQFAVLFSLSGDGHSEHFQTVLNNRHRFAVTHVTKLIGVLKLRAQIGENGQPVGTAAVRTVTVADPLSAGATADGGTTSPSGASSQPSPAPEKPPTTERPPDKPYVVPCAPPTWPALEPGMGIVTGSFYLAGGPYPGEYVCTGATITITTLKGEVVGTEQIYSPESYAIAVPAGIYHLSAVATGIFVNGQLATLSSEEISVSVGAIKEISPVEYGIP